MRGGCHPAPGRPAGSGLGRSKGRFSSKIHVLVDALGNPLRFIAAGQVAEVTQAPTLLAGQSATHAIMDKAYDADAVLDWLIRQAILR
ncbi:MAG: transposase [Candidatus Competibacteraceae bacterium]|nr:transposase [Candidatus Competibacteraceae bacterium]